MHPYLEIISKYRSLSRSSSVLAEDAAVSLRLLCCVAIMHVKFVFVGCTKQNYETCIRSLERLICSVLFIILRYSNSLSFKLQSWVKQVKIRPSSCAPRPKVRRLAESNGFAVGKFLTASLTRLVFFSWPQYVGSHLYCQTWNPNWMVEYKTVPASQAPGVLCYRVADVLYLPS